MSTARGTTFRIHSVRLWGPLLRHQGGVACGDFGKMVRAVAGNSRSHGG